MSKRCAFCTFESDDKAAFAGHMKGVHHWGEGPSPRTTAVERVAALITSLAGLYALGMLITVPFCSDYMPGDCAGALIWPVGVLAVLVILADRAVLRSKPRSAWRLLAGSALAAGFSVWWTAHYPF